MKLCYQSLIYILKARVMIYWFHIVACSHVFARISGNLFIVCDVKYECNLMNTRNMLLCPTHNALIMYCEFLCLHFQCHPVIINIKWDYAKRCFNPSSPLLSFDRDFFLCLCLLCILLLLYLWYCLIYFSVFVLGIHVYYYLLNS